MRTFAALVEGAVVWTRSPVVSPSSMAMLPGVIRAFSSISSRFTTSTRSGTSWMRRSPWPAVTVISSASSIGWSGVARSSAGSGGSCAIRREAARRSRSVRTVSLGMRRITAGG